jgi:hypothetical protein
MTNTLTQLEINTLNEKGFDINLTKQNNIWFERQWGLKKANWKYLINLLNNKNISFDVNYWRGDGDKGRNKEIWIGAQHLDSNISLPVHSLYK